MIEFIDYITNISRDRFCYTYNSLYIVIYLIIIIKSTTYYNYFDAIYMCVRVWWD